VGSGLLEIKGGCINMFIDAFQEKIWKDKYQYDNETFEEFCKRLSYNIFNSENELVYRDLLLNKLLNFEVLFGGRINANIGTFQSGTTLFNCYIASTKYKDIDSLEGILELAKDFALTLKSEGGIGFCANFLRPKKTLIRKIGVSTPGAIKFLEIFDKVSDVITAGSTSIEDSFQGTPSKKSIRKGATMVTMSICHPDIEEFITAKSIPNRLTKMNMSVLVTDAFMHAVNNDLMWDLWFPDINFEKYENEWDGSFEKWAENGYPTVTYKKIKATALWDLLLSSSWHRNEPGILFVDTMRKYNNLHYLKDCEVNATNPCVVEGSMVPTENGIVPIEKIVEGQSIQTTLGFGPVKKISVYDNQDIYRVYFNDGFYQDVTKGHIFHSMLSNGKGKKTWSNAKRLVDGIKVGDFVRKEWYKKYPEIDLSLNRDDGLLIGLYLGDGCFSNRQCFNISCNSNTDNSFVEELFIRLGGGCRIDKSEGDCYRYYMTYNKEYLNNLFDKLKIDEKNKSFDICNLINTNRNFILGLIDGLISSNGNINMSAKCAQVRFANTSDLLHKLIKQLFLFVKADYKVYNTRKVGDKSVLYGRTTVRKRDYKEGVIENDSILNMYNEIGYLSNVEKNTALLEIIKTKQLNGVKWKTKIKKIEHIGKGKVYDLYEEKADDWNHEGYVSRGCAEVFAATGMVRYNGNDIKIGDVCNLGSINIVKFYDITTKEFDYKSFSESAALMARALDNIIDVSNYPLKQYEDAAKLRRKIGVGITGIGSLLMMMNIRYGSEESLLFLEEVLKVFMNSLYRESAIMAKEKGPFAIYSDEMLSAGYVNLGILDEEVIDLIKKNGLRNCALSAIAPNGSLAIIAGNVSGGVEPVFSKEFFRWNRVINENIDFKYPDVQIGEWFETDYFKETIINGEKFLMSTDEKYRIDMNVGLCEKIVIQDYGYKIAKENNFENTYGAMELSVEEHLAVLGLFSKYIDLSVSKTINIPEDCSLEEFKRIYSKLYEYGVKGCTTYREGSTVCVLEAAAKDKEKTIKQQQKEFLSAFKEQQNGDIIAHHVKLPDEYPAKGYILKTEGKKFYLHVCFKDKACTKPFAIFVNTNAREDNVSTFNALEKLEEIAIYKGLNKEFIEETKRKYSYQKNPVKICRMLGLLLRHNIDIFTIVKGLDELEGAGPATFVFRIKKFLSQFVGEHEIKGMVCPECGEKNIVFKEGCFQCMSCMYSRCG